MVISRKQESPKCDIFINKVKLKQTEKFKYLGTIISNNGKTNREISARTAQAKINFQKMKTILTNKHISIETRKSALQCYIEPVLMYGCEAWTISKQIQNKLEATEMWFLRRMLRIPWTAKKTNERVLNEANKRRSLVRTIRKRQATFLGHVMRRGKLEHLGCHVTRGFQGDGIDNDCDGEIDEEKCLLTGLAEATVGSASQAHLTSGSSGGGGDASTSLSSPPYTLLTNFSTDGGITTDPTNGFTTSCGGTATYSKVSNANSIAIDEGITTYSTTSTTDSTIPGGETANFSITEGEAKTNSIIPGGETTDFSIPGGRIIDSTIPNGGTTHSTIPGGVTTSASTIPLGEAIDSIISSRGLQMMF
ncbi:RNA-directed DNA polymerase from mobile element jockey [Plakobranchus ocellatus]|uniref:RNA-directed DNA polymerase from mobile element jockey n=1 Tax=Plakobranchus ocellatus TaxID=259542 RepID=A0AAV4DU08_9GAST|nr:RNA-directed DNA polymerase from mobile element jockey [Plakobranchus ocellatus]